MDTMPEFNMMIDVETTSLVPWRGRVTSFAGVIFDKEFKVLGDNYVCVGYMWEWLPNFEDSDDTLQFRKNHGIDEAENALEVESVDLLLTDLDKQFQTFPGMHIWAKPAVFDVIFLSRLYHILCRKVPWHYRAVRDLASYCAGLGFDLAHVQSKEVAFIGTPHNALDDARHQVACLKYCVDNS